MVYIFKIPVLQLLKQIIVKCICSIITVLIC